jgi:hypothetical protein
VCAQQFVSYLEKPQQKPLGQAHTKETGNCYKTATSRYFCQTKLNTWNRTVPHTVIKLQCHFTTHRRPSNSRRLVFIIDYSSSVVQISLAYVPLNLLCDVLFRFYTICLPYQLFWPTSISFQFYFISCTLHSALLMFTTQVAAITDIIEIKCATLKNCYHDFSYNLSVCLLCDWFPAQNMWHPFEIAGALQSPVSSMYTCP